VCVCCVCKVYMSERGWRAGPHASCSALTPLQRTHALPHLAVRMLLCPRTAARTPLPPILYFPSFNALHCYALTPSHPRAHTTPRACPCAPAPPMHNLWHTHTCSHTHIHTYTHARARSQCVHHPILYFPSFYALRGYVAGDSVQESMQRCNEDLWQNLKALWVIWVPAQVSWRCVMGFFMRIQKLHPCRSAWQQTIYEWVMGFFMRIQKLHPCRSAWQQTIYEWALLPIIWGLTRVHWCCLSADA